MMSPLLFSGTGGTDQLRKSCQKRKYDSLNDSSEDSSISIKPIHLRSPFAPIYKTDNSSNDSCPLKVKAYDSNEIFECNPKKMKYSDPNSRFVELMLRNRENVNFREMDTKAVIDKIFEPFDDPYARLPIVKTPNCKKPIDLDSPECPDSPEHIPLQVLYDAKKAIIESQKDICRSLMKHGIDPYAHMTSELNSIKKSCKKVNFGCSTPKVYSRISACNTPIDRYRSIDSPMSGVKVLKDCEDSIISEFNCNFSFTPLQNRNADLSLNETLSPTVNIPPEIKATILSGIVCYVDFRYEKTNKSDIIKHELLSLGAMIEKNFTKKVTHVIFKEGRVSTYIKAKKQGIPIVSVMWIEACKAIRGIADPKEHYPHHMERYDDLLPYQMVPRTRVPILNPNSRVRRNLLMFKNRENGIMQTPSPIKEKRSRKAKTEVKGGKNKSINGSKNAVHGKKNLFGISENQENIQPEHISLTDQSNERIQSVENSSTDDSALIRAAAIHRRKSAPGKLLSKKNARKEDIKAYFQSSKTDDIQKDVSFVSKKFQKLKADDIDSLIESPGIARLKDDDELLDNSPEKENLLLEGFEHLQKSAGAEKKKKKLFDPDEVFFHSGISPVPQDDGGGSSVSIPSYIADTPKRARTKATNPSRSLKITMARKLHEKKANVFDDESSPSGLLFVERSQTKKPKQQPSITLTSVPRSDVQKYIEMINKLGKFTSNETVTKQTTHVVCNGPRRTLNVVKGIARGCWLVDLKWLVESEKQGRWLPEEDYDLSSHFPAAQDCCKERRGLKSTHVVDVFKNTGQIFVSQKTVPPRKDLIQILRICSANITFKASTADIIIGKHLSSSSSAKNVIEKWVLDCVTRNSLLPIENYTLTDILNKESQNS